MKHIPVKNETYCGLGASTSPGAIGVPNAFFGEGLGISFVSNVRCFGNESKLLSCPLDYGPTSCSHSQDSGVICQGTVQAIALNSHCLTNILHGAKFW